MENTQRYKKLRLLVRKVNKTRKKQAKKIDILCNDLIAAQREFIKKLDTITFAAHFYEAIIGANDLNSLFYIAAELIKTKIHGANVAFFLRNEKDFKLFASENPQPITAEKTRLENFFSAELVNSICESNRVCNLEDFFAMGLQGNPVHLNQISAAAVPLGQLGPPLGFILVYRSAEKKLTPEEINNITAIKGGLAHAIQAHQPAAQTSGQTNLNSS